MRMDASTANRWGLEDAEVIIRGTMAAEVSRMDAESYARLARIQHYLRSEWRKLVWPNR